MMKRLIHKIFNHQNNKTDKESNRAINLNWALYDIESDTIYAEMNKAYLQAEAVVLKWADEQKIHINRIIFTFPSEIHVFFENYDELSLYQNSGIKDQIVALFNDSFKEQDYSVFYNGKINYQFDSYETILEHYQGSYINYQRYM